MNKSSENKSIVIPDKLYKRLSEKVKSTKYRSVDEYAVSLLEQALKNEEEKPALTKEEEEEVKKRLKDLGYLS